MPCRPSRQVRFAEVKRGAIQQQAREQVRQAVQSRIRTDKAPLSFAEREQITDAILDELFGLDPLEQILADPEISDILVNGYDTVYIERKGKLQLTDVQFDDDEHLMGIISRIVARVGRGSTSRRPWSTPACRTDRASTPSSRPWRWTGPCCPSAASGVRR